MNKVLIEDVNLIENVASDSDERETSITFSYNDKVATIFTSDNTILTKIKKCIIKNKDGWKCWEAGRNADGRVIGYFFETPKKHIKFSAGSSTKKKEYSEEERKAIGARLHRSRKKETM